MGDGTRHCHDLFPVPDGGMAHVPQHHEACCGTTFTETLVCTAVCRSLEPLSGLKRTCARDAGHTQRRHSARACTQNAATLGLELELGPPGRAARALMACCM